MAPRSIALLAVAALASCKAGDTADESSQSRTALVSQDGDRGEAASTAPAGGIPGGQATEVNEPAPRADQNRPRKIIRTGSLLIEVDDYEKARGAIEGLVRGSGGFVAGVDVGRHEGAVGAATLTLRIPEGQMDGAVAALSKLGTLRRESLRAEDVSDTYHDLAARLRNAKKLEERMLELAERAGGVKDLLEVEREVGRVRESVEVMEGQLRGLDDRTSLATLTVEVVTRAVYVPEVQVGLGGKVSGAFASSLRALEAAAEGLLLFLVAALPWLLPLGLGAWILRRALRMRRRA
jgi:hypothetical protein